MKKKNVPAESDRMIHSEILGRDEVLDPLELRVSLLINGEGSIVNVTGEAGVGKSRLIAELKKKEVAGRADILEGKAEADGENWNFHPISGFLRRWAGIGDKDDDKTQLEKLERLLRRVCPKRLEEPLPFLARIMGVRISEKYVGLMIGAEGERLEKLIIKNLRTLLREASLQKPLVIILEDMHWADASSIRLLESLLDLAERERILFVNLFRPPHSYPETSGWLSDMARNAYSERHWEITLDPLSAEDGEKLVDNLLMSGDAPESFKKKVAEKSGGNPLFIEEIIRSLIDRGALVKSEDRFEFRENPDEIAVPDRVHEILTLRLKDMDEETKRLVDTAAVIGGSFPGVLLRKVAEDMEGVDEKLLSMERVQLIGKNKERTEFEYSFRHDLIRDAVYDSIPDRDRKELHLKTARSIEETFERGKLDIHGRLAYHYVRADDMDKAEEHMLKAGAEAMKASVSSEGMKYYLKALEIYEGKAGDETDLEKAIMIKKNIMEAMFDKGDIRAIEYSDSVLKHYGIDIPKKGWLASRMLISSSLRLLARMLLPFKIARKPTPPDVEKLLIIGGRIRILHYSNSKRAIEEFAALFLGNLIKLDISREHPELVRMVIATSWLLTIEGSRVTLYISRKILAWVKSRVSESDRRLRLDYEIASLIYNFYTGEWDSINEYDPKLVRDNLRMGEVRFVSFYAAIYGMFSFLRGRTSLFKKADEKMDVLIGEYNDNISKFFTHLVRGTYITSCGKVGYERMMRELESGFRDMRDEELNIFQVHIGYMLVYAKLQRGEIDEAGYLFEEVETMRGRLSSFPGAYAALPLKVKFYFFLAKLERGIAKGESVENYRRSAFKAGLEALKISRRIRVYRTGTLRLMGVYHWLTGARNKALKWFAKSVAEGESMDARVELARTYFEIGKRLSEKSGRRRKLNFLGADEYLEKSRRMFDEMEMDWDKEQLGKLQLVREVRKPGFSRAEKLERILQLSSSSLSRFKDFNGALRVILQETKKLFSASGGFILLKDKTNSRLSHESDSGFSLYFESESEKSGVESVRIDEAEGICGEVFRSDAPDIANSAGNSSFFGEADDLIEMEFKNLMATSLKIDDLGIGVLAVANKKRGKFYADDLDFLQRVAGQVSIILERARELEKKIISEKLAGIGETVARLSHDIRNIVPGLKTGSNILESYIEAADSPIDKKAFKIMNLSISRMSSLAMSMVEYSKGRELSRQPSDLNSMIRHAVESLEYGGEYKDAKIELDLQSDLGEIELDQEGVHRCLLNLIKNALEATEGQEERIISVATVKRGGRRADIKISDNGCGIEAKDMDRLFAAFYSSKGSKGTGLGLAIVRKIIDKHKGEIRVSSKVGRGSLFTIILPITQG